MNTNNLRLKNKLYEDVHKISEDLKQRKIRDEQNSQYIYDMLCQSKYYNKQLKDYIYKPKFCFCNSFSSKKPKNKDYEFLRQNNGNNINQRYLTDNNNDKINNIEKSKKTKFMYLPHINISHNLDYKAPRWRENTYSNL
jgi:hypothetical protein